jgi:hypothetical protein
MGGRWIVLPLWLWLAITLRLGRCGPGRRRPRQLAGHRHFVPLGGGPLR